MKRLLWIGDAGVPSGFARVTHSVLETLHEHFDVTVLGINYRGDPHNYPYPIYAAAPGGDPHGVLRLLWMCDLVKPDVIVIQQDAWNIPPYLDMLRAVPEYASIPVVGVIPVDGKNCNGKALNGLTLTVFLTEFGRDEAVEGGYTGPSDVIQHGIDCNVYQPIPDKAIVRHAVFGTDRLNDAFIVGNLNRNQPRKRFDLLIKYFAEWVHGAKIDDAWLFLRVAPTGDTGVDIKALARYYGIIERLILSEPATFHDEPEIKLVDLYNTLDVFANTTQGEGWGLTVMEAMACGVPVVAPDWAALGEWTKDAAWLVPCTSTAVGPPYLGVIGGIPDQYQFMQALTRLYRDKDARAQNSAAGLERVRDPKFRWAHVGQLFLAAVTEALTLRAEAAKIGPGSSVAEDQAAGQTSPLAAGQPVSEPASSLEAAIA